MDRTILSSHRADEIYRSTMDRFNGMQDRHGVRVPERIREFVLKVFFQRTVVEAQGIADEAIKRFVQHVNKEKFHG